jgi:AraC-like DNA-binding protein
MDHKKKRHKQFLSLNNIIVIILLLIPFLLLLLPAYDIAQQTLTIFPAGDIRPDIHAQDDKVLGGNSQIESFYRTPAEMQLHYRLRPGSQFPSVFIIFSLGTSEKPFDLTGIKSVSIDIDKATTKNILLFFQTFVPGVSRPELKHAMTWRPNQYSFELKPGVHSYTVGIEKFVTELWWLAATAVDPARLPKEDYKRVINFTIMLNPYGSDYIINRPEQIVIKKVVFTKSMSGPHQVILACIVLFYTGFYILQLVQHLRTHLSKLPERKPVQVVSYYERDLGRIKKFLAVHYCQPDISLNQIYRELGIPKTRIANILYNEYRLKFRQVINTMRIAEAKRLLLQTDLKIVDLAFALGYKNITYFNLLFKKQTGLTPTVFKKKRNESIKPVLFIMTCKHNLLHGPEVRAGSYLPHLATAWLPRACCPAVFA